MSADAHNNNIAKGNEQLFSIVSHLSLLFVFDCIIEPMKFSKHCILNFIGCFMNYNQNITMSPHC